MFLYKTMKIQKGDCIALVGAGGKTSIMHALADELSHIGHNIILTTTTRMEVPESRENLVIEQDIDRIVHGVTEKLKTSNVVILASDEANGKLIGINNSIIPCLNEMDGIDNVIVEADGSAKKPFKAPAGHEPVVPPSCTILVCVVGIDAIGVQLTANFVHRPEIIAELTNLSIGEIVTASAIAQVLAHPSGGMKNKPANARFISIINKVDGMHKFIDARDISSRTILNGVSTVLITTFNPRFKIVECLNTRKKPKITAIVLAAGKSTRFGQPKLGLDLGGRTVLQRVVENALKARVSEVVLVHGKDESHKLDEMRGLGKSAKKTLKLVQNLNSDRGQSYSLKMGLKAITKETDAVIFLMGDQPFINHNIIDSLIAEYNEARALITAPCYHGQRGTPVIFDHVLFGELMQVQGDIGGREIINKYWDKVMAVNIEYPNAELDIDTWKDYHQAYDQFKEEQSARNN